MSKVLVFAFAIASLLAVGEAKIRPFIPEREDAADLRKVHERKVRAPLVDYCSRAIVANGRDSPNVGAAACDNQCLFKDDQNEWCWTTSAPMLTAGFRWTQATVVSPNYWRIEFQPYLTTQIVLTQTIVIKKLLQQAFVVDLGKFETSIFYSFLFEDTGQVCLGFGLDSDEIVLDLATHFEFQDCYKTVIADLCDWQSTAAGKDAKWIDECSSPTSTALISLKKWTLSSALDEQALLGGTVSDGRGCWQFANWSNWAPYLARYGYDFVRQYVVDPEALASGPAIPHRSSLAPL